MWHPHPLDVESFTAQEWHLHPLAWYLNPLAWHPHSDRVAPAFVMGTFFLAFAKFGTGEGLLVYRMDARYRRSPPGVRDAFSEALGAKNRLLLYGMYWNS